MAPSVASPLTVSPVPSRDWKGFALRAAIIFLAAMFVYIPAIQSKWIWDDNLLITQYVVMQHEDGLRIFWLSSLLSKQLPWFEKHAPRVLKTFPWIRTDAELADTVPDYYPITWTTLWWEWRIWGDYPAAYHVSNCVMHAIGAVLVWRVLAALSIPGAFLAGLVFAVHPVNVCSVAWVSERKNTLSIIFFLLTLLFYFKSDQRRRWCWYVLALFMFLCALLSKASVVTLPVVLLLAAWWRRARGGHSPRSWVDRLIAVCLRGPGWVLRRRPVAAALGALGNVPGLRHVGRWLVADWWRDILADLVRTAPFFLLGLATSYLIVQFQIDRVIRREEIFRNPGEGTIWWRLAMAGLVPWFYLYKALLPIDLLMIYPRWSLFANVLTGVYHWQLDPALLAWVLPPFCLPTVPMVATRTGWAFHPEALWDLRGAVALVIVGVVLLVMHRQAWARHLIFAGGYFLLLLFPTLGFFDMYFFVHSLVADHWQYLSIIGVIALVIGVGTWAFQRGSRELRWAGVAAGVAVVIVLGVLTWNQTLVYEDQITLWRYNLPKYEGAWMGQYNLGTTLAERAMAETNADKSKKMMEEALVHLKKATELKPDDDAALNNVGLTLMNLNRVNDAIPYLQRAVDRAQQHKNPQAAMNLSLAYRATGNLPEAMKWAHEAYIMNPNPPPTLCVSYAETLAMVGRPEEGIQANSPTA